MPIPVNCDCGKSMRVKDELAGKRIRCPECREVIAVAGPKPQKDFEEEASDFLLEAPDSPVASPDAIRPARFDDEFTRASSRPSAIPEPPNRASKTSRPKKAARREKSESGGFRIAIHPSIVTGLLMMTGAAVWFFLGLAAGRIFFYPPVLFVLGIAAVVRGFLGQD